MTTTADTPFETLSQFNLAETDDGYLLEIGGSGGSVLTLATTAAQIGAIMEALDALVSTDADEDENEA